MSAQSQSPAQRQTPPSIRARKGGEPLVCLTAYDAPTAALLDPHCDLLLVGDSLGMVVHGLPNTIGVTLEMMILHGRAVMRGSSRALVAIDMPFGSYEKSREQAFENAARVLAETGAQAVKLESGVYAGDTIRFLAERGIPVIGHVGLRPQAALADGGFKAKGKTEAERARVLDEARAADAAGAFAIVVEGVAQDLAEEITDTVSAPTIGIGASARCDGQILVTNDMLGQTGRVPKFVRKFADMRALTEDAVKAYAEAVRARTFPGGDHVYGAKRG
ncbi:3-methyl-2-oxobutanoate hydroxymethyltransferase [Marinicauda algicola]|uniref:3-methyl-2-oxobutanoate hydroxymethyltransferase n=1 Tax=Marinicauda algicola TaxID=2029849 RepID=A0A4S2GYG0_9PROT|nr:3-methyl-2-oxobutanoate hydroxymethyltransferase [Marinicauda algicola]TGY87978.1 3-methyl-2-oxobutanoate hydroxymethyltransferase [Marinicauda algicola]